MIERATAPGILMVSKPVRPPWNDSSKNLVKDLATAGRDFNYHVLTPDRYSLPGPAVVSEPIYHDGGRHSPALLQNVRVLARLLRPDRTVLTHFFYAPNPRTSAAARLALKIRPRIAVQTVCSTPASFEDPQKLLFGRRVVVLSEDTRQRFIGAGIAAERLVRIPPGIQLPPASTAREVRLARQHFGLPLDRPLVLYPGDYQFSNAAKTFALAAGRIRGVSPEPVFVLACRPKQRRSVVEAEEVQKILHSSGIRCRTRIFGELPDMLRLLRACDLCVLAPESLYAKMDLPWYCWRPWRWGSPWWSRTARRCRSCWWTRWGWGCHPATPRPWPRRSSACCGPRRGCT